MQFGIDASRATNPQPTGTEYYSFQIIRAFSKLKNDHRFILYSRNQPPDALANLGPRFEWKVMPFPRLWSQVRLSWEFLNRRPRSQVVFEPAHTVPLIHPKGMVTTIHDLGFLHYPELYTPLERRYHTFSFRFSAKHSARLIAVSEYTKKDILNAVPTLDPEKITVIHHGFHADLYHPQKTTQRRVTLGFRQVERPYFLFIGRIEEKKNIARLLSAFARFGERHPQYSLALVGKPGYGYDRFRSLAMEFAFNIRSRIHFLGYVSEEKAAELMQNAAAFVFPSLFEGFGMPILEAMATRIPVVTSNTTSLPEVAADAALQVAPTDVKALTKALSEVIKPAVAAKLVANGSRRVKQFSWDKAARQTLKVLEKTAADVAG